MIPDELMGLEIVWLAATALGGFAHGLGPSRSLARVGLASLWLEFTFAFSMLVPVSLLRWSLTATASGYEHQEEKKQIWKVEEAACFFWNPSCTFTGSVALVAAAALAAVKDNIDVAAAASCGAIAFGMGATLVTMFGIVVVSVSMMCIVALDGAIQYGTLAPAAAAMVFIGTLV